MASSQLIIRPEETANFTSLRLFYKADAVTQKYLDCFSFGLYFLLIFSLFPFLHIIRLLRFFIRGTLRFLWPCI